MAKRKIILDRVRKSFKPKEQAKTGAKRGFGTFYLLLEGLSNVHSKVFNNWHGVPQGHRKVFNNYKFGPLADLARTYGIESYSLLSSHD